MSMSAQGLAPKKKSQTPEEEEDTKPDTISQDSGYGSSITSPKTERPSLSPLSFSRKPIPAELERRFRDLRLLLNFPLHAAISTKTRPTRDISMKLKYTTPGDVPCIVIQCDKHVVKRVKKFFAQKHIKEAIGEDFGIHVAPGLRQLAVAGLPVLGDMNVRTTFCGMRVAVINEAEGTCKSQTLGGLVAVTKSSVRALYGLTAGHGLADVMPLSKDQVYSDTGAERETDDCSTSSDEESTRSGITDESMSDVLDEVDHAANMSKIGTIADHSFQKSSVSTNLDWALVDLSEIEALPNLVVSPELRVVMPMKEASQAFETPYVEVDVLTFKGKRHGTLTRGNSCLMVAPGKHFAETYNFVPGGNCHLEPGDSGSWVVREDTGDVYGHVVSVDMFGEAYVMPLCHTLASIRTQLEADNVCLQGDGLKDRPPPRDASDQVQSVSGGPRDPFHQSMDIFSDYPSQMKCPSSVSMPSLVEDDTSLLLQSRAGSSDTKRSTSTTSRASHQSSFFQSQNKYYLAATDTYDLFPGPGYQNEDFLEGRMTLRGQDSPVIQYPLPAPVPKPATINPIIERDTNPFWKTPNIKTKSVRPNKRKVFCDQCDEHKEGFRGKHELHQHKETRHAGLTKKWVCIDPGTLGLPAGAVPINPLNNCEACRTDKKYAADYHAAAHLRRTHFKEPPARRQAGEKRVEKRGGKGGGDWPPMSELKYWMKEVYVPAVKITYVDTSDDEAENPFFTATG
ncbi:hypothetical protein F4778DRAFT_783283 [Xylariomycetidae sp. FL2044]|nr:hypothetical protein F4778DRAFT_783283 [Xylariomycetidae sp. FL2044]